MDYQEFEDRFDVLYNNITSNQAPGLNSYEKSVFLTKAQDEILKNYFNPKSNKLQEGYDDNQKRQIDFSNITKTSVLPEYRVLLLENTQNSYSIYSSTAEDLILSGINFNINSSNIITASYSSGGDILNITLGTTTFDKDDINEAIENARQSWNSYTSHTPITSIITFDFTGRKSTSSFSTNGSGDMIVLSELPTTAIPSKIDDRSQLFFFPKDAMFIINERITSTANGLLRVIPIDFEEYDRLMSKPYKYPTKYTAWRLINSGEGSTNQKYVEIIAPGKLSNYKIRYVKTPMPIILANLDGLTINGKTFEETTCACELDPNLHEEILQRAVELAKVAWTSAGNDNAQAIIQSGQRSE